MGIERITGVFRGNNVKRGGQLLASAIAIIGLGCGTAQSSSSVGLRSPFAHGRTAGYKWRSLTEANGGRHGGICLEVAVFKGSLRHGGNINSRCSKPAPGRGSLVGAVEPNYRGGRPRVTAVSAAFSPVVKRVVAEDFDGSHRALRLKRIRLRGTPVFGYAGFAVRGAWCAKELRTYDKRGDELWAADAEELAKVVGANGYHPVRFCPH